MNNTKNRFCTKKGSLNKKGVQVAEAAYSLIAALRPDLDWNTAIKVALELVFGTGHLLDMTEPG